MPTDEIPDSEQPTAFVLMPFEPEFDRIYSELIAPALETAGYRVARADSVLNQRNILSDIVRGIAGADLVVAELTTQNPNVFYELGLAHGLGKPTVLIAQDIEELPFDLRSYRAIIYSTHFDSVRELHDGLRDIGVGALDCTIEFGSPVADFAPGAPTAERRAAGIGGLTSAGEPAGVDDGLEADEEELGILDFQVAVAEEGVRIGELIDSLNDKTTGLTETTSARTAELEAAAARGGPGEGAARLRIARTYSEELDDYARWVHEMLPEFEGSWDRLGEAGSGLVSLTTIEDEDDREAARQLAATLKQLAAVIDGSLESIRSMRASASGLRERRISRDVSRSAASAVESLDGLIEQWERAQSYAVRIEGVVAERLSEHSRTEGE